MLSKLWQFFGVMDDMRYHSFSFVWLLFQEVDLTYFSFFTFRIIQLSSQETWRDFATAMSDSWQIFVVGA